MSPSLPAASDVVDVIRTSTAALNAASGIAINEAAIDDFLQQLRREDWEAEAGAEKHGIRMPLAFDTPDAELNMLCVLSLLNFLSGYRKQLKRLTSRGAWENIMWLCMSSHLSSDPLKTPLSTSGMLSATPSSLATLIGIQTHVEKDHPTLGSAVRVGEKDDEAIEVLELLSGVLNQTGEILKTAAKKNLGEWVRERLEMTEGDVGAMIIALVGTFPAFRDAYEIDGQPVFILKKALFLLTVIKLSFAPPTHSSPPFPLPKDLTRLPVFADNVLPTLLLHYGIIDTSSSSDPSITPEALRFQRLLSTPSMTRLRSASIVACRRIVERAVALAKQDPVSKSWMGAMNEQELDGYLWTWAKKGPGLRELERLAEHGTVMY